MTWTKVQEFDSGNSGESGTSSAVAATAGTPLTAGNFIVGWAGIGTAGGTVTSITDPSNTYTALNVISSSDPTGGETMVPVWGQVVTGGETVVKAALSNTAPFRYLHLVEYNLDSGVPVLDQQGQVNFTSACVTTTDGCSSAAITPGFNGELIVGMNWEDTFSGTSVTGTVSAGTNFSSDGTMSTAVAMIEHYSQPTASSLSATFTRSSSMPLFNAVLSFQASSVVPIQNGGYYLQEDGVSKFTLEDGSGFYLIQSWVTSAAAGFIPLLTGDWNGIGSSGRFFKDRLG